MTTWHRITRSDWYADGIDSHDASDCTDPTSCRGEVVRPGDARHDLRDSWMRREQERRKSTPESRVQDLEDLSVKASMAERAVRDAVVDARLAGLSWSAIGAPLGMTKQGAQQRYGSLTSN